MTDTGSNSQSKVLPVRVTPAFAVHESKGIIVAGGLGGSGRATVELLLSQGARVAVIDKDHAEVNAYASSLGGAAKGCFGTAADITSESEIKSAVDRCVDALGKVDGLVNAAGIVIYSDPLSTQRTDWQSQFDVNLFGAYTLTSEVARYMIDHGVRGAIVSIASDAAKRGHMEYMAYSASKAGVVNMTRMLSDALAPFDINVNCICPGGVATPMLRQVADDFARLWSQPADAIFEKMLRAQLRRHVQPVEVARVISFLLSDDAILIRGQAINADAGETPY